MLMDPGVGVDMIISTCDTAAFVDTFFLSSDKMKEAFLSCCDNLSPNTRHPSTTRDTEACGY